MNTGCTGMQGRLANMETEEYTIARLRVYEGRVVKINIGFVPKHVGSVPTGKMGPQLGPLSGGITPRFPCQCPLRAGPSLHVEV